MSAARIALEIAATEVRIGRHERDHAEALAQREDVETVALHHYALGVLAGLKRAQRIIENEPDATAELRAYVERVKARRAER